MKIENCPLCGHPMAGDDVAAVLPPKQRHLYEIVKAAGAAGISARDIMGKLYADDPSGGPVTSNIVAVFSHYANIKIRPFGLKISARRGPWPLWRLLKIE